LGQLARAYPVPRKHSSRKDSARAASAGRPARENAVPNTQDARRRVFALPHRAAKDGSVAATAQLSGPLTMPRYSPPKSSRSVLEYDPRKMRLRPLRAGSEVVAGTVLGRVGRTGTAAPHVNFSIRPAGKRSPRIDPKPILDGWKLLEATAVYRAAGKNPFTDNAPTTVSQDLL